jgi:TonB family protein
MRLHFKLLALIGLTALVPSRVAAEKWSYRPDVLYFSDTPGGRKGADEIRAMFGANQRVAVVEEPIPKMKDPVLIEKLNPKIPEALRGKINGHVTFVFIVNAQGNVKSASIVQSDNHLIDQAVLDALRHWKFKPAQMKGRGVSCCLKNQIFFKPVP